jgi:hypothetical protein
MAFRATITVLRAEADTKYVSPSASIDNVNAEAIAVVNPDSKNQWFYDTYALGDVNVLLINKNLSELIPLADDSSWSFGKNKLETLALVESFVKAVTYNRAFNDAFTLDDLSQIDKDFYGNKGNVAFITDIIGLDHTKALTDSYTVTDVVNIAMLFVRTFTDSTSFSDDSYHSFGGNKTDTLNLSEEQAKDVSKLETDSFSYSDDATLDSSLNKTDSFSIVEALAHSFIKTVADAFTLDDSALINKDFYGAKGNVFGFSDLLGNDFGKILIDSISHLDAISFIQGLNKSDSTTLSDAYSSTLHKAISDVFTLDDSTLINKDYYGNKGNVFVFSDILSYESSKALTESIALVELVGFVLNHPIEDSYTVTDSSYVHPNLIKSESLGFSDSYIRNIMKGLSDAFALDDTARVDKSVGSTKGNVFGFSDEFSRSVSFNRAYQESLGLTEVFARNVTYIRTYSDSYSVSDERDVQINKGISDTVLVSDDTSASVLNTSALNTGLLNGSGAGDSVTLGAGLGRPESLILNEIIGMTHSKNLSDLPTLIDAFGLQLEKTFTDAFALDDSALIDKDFYGNKGNTVGLSDVVSVRLVGNLLGQRPLNTMSLN